jgi:hypothetical protein
MLFRGRTCIKGFKSGLPTQVEVLLRSEAGARAGDRVHSEKENQGVIGGQL